MAGDSATAPQEVPGWTAEPGPPYRGMVSIEWPPPAGSSPYACMLGRSVKVTDAVTGKVITTCSAVDVHAAPGALVTADLTLFADAAGEPLLEGKPAPGGGEVRTGTFPFVVSEMRVRAR